jgi:hypothetical protein
VAEQQAAVLGDQGQVRQEADVFPQLVGQPSLDDLSPAGPRCERLTVQGSDGVVVGRSFPAHDHGINPGRRPCP